MPRTADELAQMSRASLVNEIVDLEQKVNDQRIHAGVIIVGAALTGLISRYPADTGFEIKTICQQAKAIAEGMLAELNHLPDQDQATDDDATTPISGPPPVEQLSKING